MTTHRVPRRPRVDPIQIALGGLAEAQELTEAELRDLAARTGELAQAQKRTEERLESLAYHVEELARAQKRTEERVEELAQAQKRTEERVEELAQAQHDTILAVRDLAREVGRLSETIGFTLEDLARDLTPDRLARRHGIQVPMLERAFFRLDGSEVELDMYGVGLRNGEQVVIVGEAKSRIHGRDVEELISRAHQLAPQLPGTPVPVLFGFVIHPSAVEAATRLGAILIASGG
jgi:predicted RNase H-like nuclease (RuvC/YqgF family)